MEPLTTLNLSNPRIYVACLAAYNNGHLHGEWIDAAQDPSALNEAVNAMLATSPAPGAEEWAIHDYEGFGGVRIEEYARLEQVAELALFITTHGEIGSALLDHFDGCMDDASRAMEEHHLGIYTSLADYMQELTEDTVTIPQQLRHYIDYDAMARDAEINGDVFTIAATWNTVHIFAGF